MSESPTEAAAVVAGPVARSPWDAYGRARAALADAVHLDESSERPSSALVLYRAAASLLIRARLEHAGIEYGRRATTDQCWARFRELPCAFRDSELGEADLVLATSILGAEGEALLSSLPPAELDETLAALRRLAHTLARPLEAEFVRERAKVVARRFKIAALAVAALIVGVLVVNRLTRRENLALERKVTVQSSHPKWGTDPRQLVDGNRTNLGFHAQAAPQQSVTIDLGAVRRVSRVVTYNRADCCAERAVPLVLELSEDGSRFRTVASRKQRFDVWKADFPETAARYVRLVHPRSGFFHLSEVEVY